MISEQRTFNHGAYVLKMCYRYRFVGCRLTTLFFLSWAKLDHKCCVNVQFLFIHQFNRGIGVDAGLIGETQP